MLKGELNNNQPCPQFCIKMLFKDSCKKPVIAVSARACICKMLPFYLLYVYVTHTLCSAERCLASFNHQQFYEKKTSPFFLVVVVDGVYNFLLSIFDDLPDCATDHVTCWKRRNLYAMTFTCTARSNVQKCLR